MVEGEKKGFRCDCGNACFRQAGRLGGQLRCTLRAEGERRDETNAGNAYNHNFMDRHASATHSQAAALHSCLMLSRCVCGVLVAGAGGATATVPRCCPCTSASTARTYVHAKHHTTDERRRKSTGADRGPPVRVWAVCVFVVQWFHPSCMHEGYDWTKDEFLVRRQTHTHTHTRMLSHLGSVM